MGMIKNTASLALLGSTGSIGLQTLEVARRHNIKIAALCANTNAPAVAAQAREFGVKYCAMADESAAKELRLLLSDTDAKVYSGEDGICGMISDCPADTVLNSIVGKAGLMPTIATLKEKKKLALANKESLVVAGDIVMALAKENGIEILPVDSEHSAVYQCLGAGKGSEVKRLILTASGGPFFGYSTEMLKKVTKEQTLSHPTWNMGAKITVDSATLMNKGLEVIEASHLFGIGSDRIDVVVHRESIIHSMVEYIDNTVIAELGMPDMRSCIQYALTYPARLEGLAKPLDLAKIGKLSFYDVDADTFVLFSAARRAIMAGGALPAVLNAANEAAVGLFLESKISFYQIFQTVAETMDDMSFASKVHSLEDIISCDLEARKRVIKECSR